MPDALHVVATLGVLAGAARGVAHAETVFEEYGPGEPRREARQLVDAACELDVQLRGTVATVEMRDKLVNPGPSALAARLDYKLPRGAVVIGAAFRGDAAVSVPAKITSELVDSYDVLAADPVVLTSVGDDRYRALIQPIGANHDGVLALKYQMIAEVRDGAMRLRFPARTGGTSKIAACKATIRATPGPGASIGKIRVNGAASTGSFSVDGSDLLVAIDLEFAGKQPVVWTQSEPAGDGMTATLVTAIAPPMRSTASPAHRALFVIDGSRSMALVGPGNVARVVQAIAAALPANTQIDAIIYDRKASRVLGDWTAITPSSLKTIDTAILTHVGTNGSDVSGAFALAHTALADGARGSSMVIAITDGVLGQLPDTALSKALDAKTSTLDVHAIVLDPATTQSPGSAALRNPVNLYGGTYVELAVDDLDDALGGVAAWLRPSWLELAITGGTVTMPSELRTGSGVTSIAFHRGAIPAYVLTGHGESPIRIAARPGPSSPVATLALARMPGADFGDDERARDRIVAGHTTVDEDHAMVVLASTGRIAKSRHDMIKGGGRYTRVVDLADPKLDAGSLATASTPPTATSIERTTLERLFRDQLQPRAYMCYQRALSRNHNLNGTIFYDLQLGRGEVTQVVVTGVGDDPFRACLVDAGYQLTPPLPDFAVNADDQTVAHYPLTFNLRDDHPVIVLGDADSTSPIDIDAVQAGVASPRHRPLKVDTSTPLGGLKR